MPSKRSRSIRKKKSENGSKFDPKKRIPKQARRMRRAKITKGKAPEKRTMVYAKNMAEALVEHINAYIPSELNVRIEDFDSPPEISNDEMMGIYAFYEREGPIEPLEEYHAKCGDAESRAWYKDAITSFFRDGNHKPFVKEG